MIATDDPTRNGTNPEGRMTEFARELLIKMTVAVSVSSIVTTYVESKMNFRIG
jgi:hypothetical protein